MNRILIGALSCSAYGERRERCLRTWVPEAINSGMDVVFLIGDDCPTARRDGVNLYLPCPDDYPSLPQKVRLFYEWALAHSEFDYIFKCDDDTYLRADRLAAYATEGSDYIGAEWRPGVGFGSGGAGYWLSRRAVAIVAEALRAYPQGPEDVLVSQCLSEAGIPLRIDDRFIAIGDDRQRPVPDNEIISTHACDIPWRTHRTEYLHQRPVVSCQAAGGLGNMMFQVAAALGFAATHGTHNPLFSRNAFGSYGDSVFHRLAYGNLPHEMIHVGDATDFSYNDEIPPYPNCSVLFTGFMQSEKYFAHCAELIRRMYAPSYKSRGILSDRFGDLLATQPVGMHVRRGDYLEKQEFHPVQPADYYLRALRYIEQQVAVEKVLCFSDDPIWCRERLASADGRIQIIEGQPDYLDLALLSLCSHFINSSSSFSWWGAWLGYQAEKIVVVPDKHLGAGFGHYSERDIYPASWLRIGSILDEDDIHPRGYWLLAREPERQHVHDPGLCQELVRFVSMESGSVVDFGCGLGIYVRALREAGIECDGYDGNPHTADLTEGTCGILDLSSVAQLPRKYDWVVSLEVGEHIPRDAEDVFFGNLDRHNARGVVVSWAVEGQGGHGHINLRNNNYIHERFRRLGYYRDVIAERRLRQSVSYCEWFRNTLMCFRRECLARAEPISTEEMRLLVGRDDPVILELGCNDGIDTRRMLREFSGGTIHCFEPDPRPLRRFRLSDPRCIVYPWAIAENDGEHEFHLSGGTSPDDRMEEWDLSSSLHQPSGHLNAHPWCVFETTCQVHTRSLDSWFREHIEIPWIDFIWADIQGAECDLIRGGGDTLRNHTRYLYTEFYDEPMYDGQISGEHIMQLLPEFDCIGIFEGYNMLLQNRRLCENEGLICPIDHLSEICSRDGRGVVT